MRAEIITIGDELLIGQVVDTNSAWMAQRLNEAGIELYRITSVHDRREQILSALDEAFRSVDLVFTTGGLGPTKDDITKHVMCEYFQTHLIEDTRVRAHVEHLYADRPEILNRLTATQWMVPEAAEILTNRVGSAPIMLFNHGDQMLFAMPGVPYEMEVAMTEQIIPYITNKRLHAESIPRSWGIIHKTLQVSGISESELAIKLIPFETINQGDPSLAYLPKDGIIRLRLSSYGDRTPASMDHTFEFLKRYVKDYIIAETDDPLEVIVGSLLKERGATISTAESCTGGKLAMLLSLHEGSSEFYKGSIVSYANSVKSGLLGVTEEMINEHSVVSEEVVCQMAKAVREQTGSDYSIATSGIASATGGYTEEEVGTVWIAWSGPEGTTAKCFHLGKLREKITDRACVKALVEMIKFLRHEESKKVNSKTVWNII